MIAKRLIMVLVCMSVISASSVARSEPYVGRMDWASTILEIKGSDGFTYEVSIFAERLEEGPDVTATLAVTVEGCKKSRCKKRKAYQKEIEPCSSYADFFSGSFCIDSDGQEAFLETEFAGSTMNVVWASPGDPVADGSPPEWATVGLGGPAKVTWLWLGLSKGWFSGCSGTGEILWGAHASADYSTPEGDPEPSRPPKGLRPRGKKTPVCK